MRALALAALVWAGGCGRETPLEEYERFLGGRADRECDRRIACGTLDPAVRVECRRRLTRKEALEDPFGIRRSFADGRLRLDLDAARECLETTSRWSCYVAGLGDNWPVIEACDRAVRPNVQLGERCVSARECISSRCEGLGCDARCAVSEHPAPVAEGDACTPASCPGGLWCSGPESDRRCLSRVPVGSPCQAHAACAEGSVCIAAADGLSGTCRAPGGQGERCLGVVQECGRSISFPCPEVTDLACSDDRLRCDAGLGICVARKCEGEACKPEPCEAGLACLPDVLPTQYGDVTDTYCRKLRGPGSACNPFMSSDTGCSDFLICHFGTCVEVTGLFGLDYVPPPQEACYWMGGSIGPVDLAGIDISLPSVDLASPVDLAP